MVAVARGVGLRPRARRPLFTMPGATVVTTEIDPVEAPRLSGLTVTVKLSGTVPVDVAVGAREDTRHLERVGSGSPSRTQVDPG